MDKHVAQKRADVRSQNPEDLGKDVFTLLVQANEESSVKFKLSNEELVSTNLFSFLASASNLFARSEMSLPSFSQDMV